MRTIISSTSQLAELRASLRRDVADSTDEDVTVDGFVAAVHEVVVAAVRDGQAHDPSIDVRWRRRTEPHIELYAEIPARAEHQTR